MKIRDRMPCAAALAALALAACNSSSRPAPRRAAPGDTPPQVTIQAQSVTSGFWSGRLRSTSDVSAFSISRHPVTIAEYKRCVADGACRWPARDYCGWKSSMAIDHADWKKGAPGSPITCVGTENARRFCAWVGGRLPVLPEWLLAARGPAVQRYAWGDQRPSCELSPFGAKDNGERCISGAAGEFDVDKHPAGAAPGGMQDVLLAPGELLARSAHALLPACAAAKRGCIVSGVQRTEIDGVEPVLEQGRKEEVTTVPYAFRCVRTGGQG